MIGRRKYEELKKCIDLTNEERKEVKEYEDETGITESNRLTREYFRKLGESKPEDQRRVLTLDKFKEVFKYEFEKKELCEVQVSKQINSVLAYFCEDEIYKECVELRIKSKGLQPSIKKGLLLIGHYGNGKTSAMRLVEEIIKKYYLRGQFKGYTANEIVSMYEECKSPADKKAFWKRMYANTIYIDDVKTERESSNFGKANMIKEILEKRYERGLKTHISCNYKDGLAGDLDAGVLEFGEKYGGRVLDRLFQMFNIIEFKGKSFRM